DERPVPKQYCTGKAAFVVEAPSMLDLQALRARLPLYEEVPPDAEREEDLGARWQNVKRAWVAGNEVLTHLELGAEFAADFERVHYHPALMDRATGRAQEYLVTGLYLPIAYQRLRLHAPVPRKIFSY